LHDPEESAAFLASTVHKLGSSVGAAMNYLRLLQARGGGEDDDIVAGLESATQRSQQVLLGATRWLDAIELLGPAGPVDPAPLLQRACDAVGGLALDVALLPVVRCCADALALVFEEILRNAVQVATEVPASVRVSAQVADDTVVIALADDGPGWSAETLARAFLPFRSEPATASRPGVGLAIVAMLASAMGGAARGASREAAGAIVYLSLPAADGPIMAAEESAQP